MNKKKLTENLATKVKSFVQESLSGEDVRKNAYNAIMEYRIARQDYDSELTDDDLNRAKFRMLYDKWHKETYILSNTEQILTHPAFREIVAMGRPAVRFIMEKIATQPSFIVYALPEILGYSVASWKENGKIIPMDEQCRKWVEHLKEEIVYEYV